MVGRMGLHLVDETVLQKVDLKENTWDPTRVVSMAEKTAAMTAVHLAGLLVVLKAALSARNSAAHLVGHLAVMKVYPLVEWTADYLVCRMVVRMAEPLESQKGVYWVDKKAA
jgi:hypothetical protein